MTEPYEPHSTNAMFSRVLERLDSQDRATAAHRDEIKTQFEGLRSDMKVESNRVTALENAQWKQRGFVAAIALFVPAVWQWFTHTGKS